MTLSNVSADIEVYCVNWHYPVFYWSTSCIVFQESICVKLLHVDDGSRYQYPCFVGGLYILFTFFWLLLTCGAVYLKTLNFVSSLPRICKATYSMHPRYDFAA